jgi:hypothetical protein
MKTRPHVLLIALTLSACGAHVESPIPPTDRDSTASVATPILPPPGPDGGWIIGSDGQPIFIGQPEPHPQVWEL